MDTFDYSLLLPMVAIIGCFVIATVPIPVDAMEKKKYCEVIAKAC